MSTYQWDVFISHASEDKESVARPLADKLRTAGIRVWLDATELTLGDSLRRKIDHGLAQSRYGIVILSPAFFLKDWPQNELSGLLALEPSRSKVILPVWHQVDRDYIARYSPLLADRLGISTAAGLDNVRDAVLRVIREPAPGPNEAQAPVPTIAPKRIRKTTLTVAAVILITLIAIATAWAIYATRKTDPLARLKTPAATTAAATLFRDRAKAAGYTDAEVLDSWVGDFLFEHWIDPQLLARFLQRESAANQHGDLAIGFWTDPSAESSVWRVYSGLTTPDVRPAVTTPALTMKAGTVEPPTGAYRDNNAGLSVAAGSLVLGVYTNSYAAYATWICSNFAPQAPPFVDARPQSDDFERLSVQPDSLRCPPIRFLALRKTTTESPAERFRALLNLPTLSPGDAPAETIYLSVAREGNPHPLPVRASLLWLSR